MAENTERNKALTSTQEGIIAGLVLLFFGLLYWYLNPWQSEQKTVPSLAEPATTGTIQRNSLASTTDTSAPNSVTETSSTATPTQTASNSSTPTSTTVQTKSATSTTTPATPSAATTTVESAMAVQPVLTSPPAPVNPANQAKATANNVPPPPGPVDTQKTETVTSSTATTATTEVPKPSTETTASATRPTTETAKPTSAHANPDPATQTATNSTTVQPSTTTTAETKPTAASTTTASTANKLELAPGSPEAKLQSYLEKKTLETPVGMDGISFEAKTAKLTKESDAKVLMLAALLAQYPDANFLITSYTTETSTENKNSDDLSLMRAQTLGENLVKAGVDGKRITIMGMGKRPSPDKTSVASKKSQRIEISVIQ
ncbi:MAG: hypothetical protein E6Q85_09390 [Thiothrix sp.]|nr:MAG: hypothetical protein E6Q85_09390 [Thiothrix sp.]